MIYCVFHVHFSTYKLCCYLMPKSRRQCRSRLQYGITIQPVLKTIGSVGGMPECPLQPQLQHNAHNCENSPTVNPWRERQAAQEVAPTAVHEMQKQGPYLSSLHDCSVAQHLYEIFAVGDKGTSPAHCKPLPWGGPGTTVQNWGNSNT
jgi:hypothetical protein